MTKEETSLVFETIKLLSSLGASSFAIGALSSWAHGDLTAEDALDMVSCINDGTLADRIKVIAERPPLPKEGLN